MTHESDWIHLNNILYTKQKTSLLNIQNGYAATENYSRKEISLQTNMCTHTTLWDYPLSSPKFRTFWKKQISKKITISITQERGYVTCLSELRVPKDGFVTWIMSRGELEGPFSPIDKRFHSMVWPKKTIIYGCQPKNRGGKLVNPPNWMVPNGKPYEQLDDLGGFPPIFGSTSIWGTSAFYYNHPKKSHHLSLP